MAATSPDSPGKISAGEGERRALRGYLPQLKVAAARIVRAFEHGTLHAIAVADPEAGRVDDLQLLTIDVDALRVDAFQVKWSNESAPLTDGELRSLIADAVDGRRLLAAAWAERETPDGTPVERFVVHLHTNRPLSTAALRGEGVRGQGLTLPRFIAEVWRPAQGGALVMIDDVPEVWRPYVTGLAGQAGLGVDELLAVAPDVLVESGRRLAEDAHEVAPPFLRDLRAFVVGLLEAVTDKRDLVVIDAAAFLELVGEEYAARWRPRSQHAFPVPPDYQPMRVTEMALQRVLGGLEQGYLVVTGSPGAGKSTLLTRALHGDPRVAARYYAFVPGDDTATRGEAHALLHDLLLALDRRDRVRTLAPPRDELPLLRRRLTARLQQLGERAHASGTVAIILIDGLDHVPRDPAPETPFLGELLPADQVPDGVLFVLGTRNVEDLPDHLQGEAQQPGRHIRMQPMDRRATRSLAEYAGLTPEVQDRVWDLSDGHPLLAGTFTRLAARADDPLAALAGIPPVGGDVVRYYATIWAGLRADAQLVTVLGLVCRLRSPIDLGWLQKGGTDPAALEELGRLDHLFRSSPGSRWTFFHDSFREYLRARTAERMGAYDVAKERELHAELAQRCAATSPSRAEAWEELHHRLRAGDTASVLARATPEFFRRQMEALRPPDDVQPDIQEAAAALVTEFDALALVRLSLAAAECNLRRYHQQVTGDFLELLVDLGRSDAAIAHLRHIRDNVVGNDRTATAMDFVVAVHDRGMAAEAARVFDEYEPLDLLANRGGRRRTAAHRGPWKALYAWGAAAALVHGPEYVIEQTERLVLDADALLHGASGAEATAMVKANILASAAVAVAGATADALLAAIADDEPGRQARAGVLVARARDAIGSDRDAASALLDGALALDLGGSTAVIAAELLLRLGRVDDAQGLAGFAVVVVPPSPSGREDDRAWWRLLACARLHATLDGPLDPVAAVPGTGRDFDEPRVIVARHVVRFGNLWARHLRGEPVPVSEITAAVGTVFALWDHAGPAERRDLWQALDGRQVIAESAVELARTLGPEAVEQLWKWWQQRWSVPRHRRNGDLSLVRAFQRAGMGRLSLRERLEAFGEAVAEDADSEPEAWTELGLACLAAGDEVGARAALERWTAATFAVGFRKDYQLSTWIRLLAPALPTTAGLAPWLTEQIAELDRRAEAGAAHDASEELAKAVGRTRPAEVLDRARALVSHDVFDVNDVVVAVLDAMAHEADDAWWILVAEVLVPLGEGPIALDVAAAAAPGREVLAARLRAVAERVAVEGRPSELRAWQEELVAAAGRHGLGAQDLGIGQAELPGDGTSGRDGGGGTHEDDEDDATTAIGELLERREAGDREYSGLRPLVARLDELDAGQRARLLALAEDDEEYCDLASRFATEAMDGGRRDDAWTWAERAVGRSAARDWNRTYSGGPALTAARLLQRLDAGRSRPVIFERFAHAAASDRFLLGAIADDLDDMIDVFAPYDKNAVAQVVLDYVAALVGVPGPVLDDGGAPATVPSPARVAAELVTWLLGMVHLLAWSSAERAAMALLRAGGDAQHATRAELLGGDVPAGRVLAILGAVRGGTADDDVRPWLAQQATGPRLDDRVAAAALLRQVGAGVPEPTPRPLPGLLRLVVSRAPEVLPGGAAIGADDVDEMLDLDGGSVAALAQAADVDADALGEVIRTRAAVHAAALPADGELETRQTVLGWGFVRPSAIAVMAAEQEAAADLVDAGRVAPAVALAALDQIGRGHDELLVRRPERRPACVPAAAPLADRGVMAPDWLPGLEGAAERVAARLDGWTVIGELTELALLDRRHSREERDQALVPADASGDMFTGTRRGLRDVDRLAGLAPGASLIVRTARAGLCFGDGFIALHPVAARAAGLEPDEKEPLAWRLNGEPGVASRWWRSGFSRWSPWSDHDEVGDGWVVVASPAAVEALLGAFLGAEVRWEVRRRVRGEREDGELPARIARGTRPLRG